MNQTTANPNRRHQNRNRQNRNQGYGQGHSQGQGNGQGHGNHSGNGNYHPQRNANAHPQRQHHNAGANGNAHGSANGNGNSYGNGNHNGNHAQANHPQRQGHGQGQQRRHNDGGQRRQHGPNQGHGSNRPHRQHNNHQNNRPQQRHFDQPPPRPQQQNNQPPQAPTDNEVEGILYFLDERGDGQLRDVNHPLKHVRDGTFVSRSLINELRLRPGLILRGVVKGKHMTRVRAIEGESVEKYTSNTNLYDGTAIDPSPMIKLEHNPAELTTRAIDLLAPVGFGQRGLIVAPPRSGKTILLQNIARGIHANYPNAKLVLLLVDERPEEVTDMKRNVPGTVYASSNDNDVDKHLDLAQLVIERCKRRVEYGEDVIVLLDSLTRLGRAFNTGGIQGGRTMTGGLDNRALEVPKKLFGAARKLENAGSLTILATCLIDTGSRMDQIIFEEFKGTGNMELTLDRNLANQRIYPALNIPQSGTRKEEKLIAEKDLTAARNIRRHLINMSPAQSMKTLLDVLGKYKSNQELFGSMRL